jgi:hypothetical protein
MQSQSSQIIGLDVGFILNVEMNVKPPFKRRLEAGFLNPGEEL